MAVFGDESCILSPEEVVNEFRDRVKAILAKPEEHGLSEALK